MNLHYLELKMYLTEVANHPEVAMDSTYYVFPSENSLYREDKANHRLHPISHDIYKKVFDLSEINFALLQPLLAAGVIRMREKRCTYACDDLPGGKNWEPDAEIKTVLTELKPTNDFSESILGLNNYLTGTIPNLHKLGPGEEK